jgi:hypothetical protein
LDVDVRYACTLCTGFSGIINRCVRSFIVMVPMVAMVPMVFSVTWEAIFISETVSSLPLSMAAHTLHPLSRY